MYIWEIEKAFAIQYLRLLMSSCDYRTNAEASKNTREIAGKRDHDTIQNRVKIGSQVLTMDPQLKAIKPNVARYQTLIGSNPFTLRQSKAKYIYTHSFLRKSSIDTRFPDLRTKGKNVRKMRSKQDIRITNAPQSFPSYRSRESWCS